MMKMVSNPAQVMIFRDTQDIQLLEGLDTPVILGATINLFTALSGG